jgi:ribosome-binding factor A
MPQGNRPDRVGEAIRHELSALLAREVSDPGIGFITLTQVKVSPDLSMVRVYYTELGDDKAKRETARALQRATPFLRRQIGARVRLRRVPEIRFEFDQGVEHQARIEEILLELQAERDARGEGTESGSPEPAITPDPEAVSLPPVGPDPVAGSLQPVAGGLQPVAGSPQPVASSPQPVASSDPGAGSLEPAAGIDPPPVADKLPEG